MDVSVKGLHMDERIDMKGEPAGDKPCRYEAFISYSHTEYDARVAREVQRFIEGFHIPRALQEQAGRSRLGKVFRDEDELKTGVSLSSGIEEALRSSRWLVVVCSSAAASSSWVAREIEEFVSMHGVERVLTVLANGEPEEAFPAALRSTEDIARASNEPIAADLRASVDRSRRRRELIRLVAPLIGCEYDDLVQRQRARRRKGLVALCACAAVVLALILGMCHRAISAEATADAERNRQAALFAYEEGDRIDALRFALDGVAPGSDPVQEAEARYTLAEALGVYTGFSEPQYAYMLEDISNPTSIILNEEGGWFSDIDAQDLIHIYDVATGATTQVIDYRESGLESMGVLSGFQWPLDDDLLVGFSDGGLACFDGDDGTLVWCQEDAGWVSSVENLGDGRIALESSSEHGVSLVVLNAADGEIVSSTFLDGFGERPSSMIHAMTATVDTAAVTIGNQVAIIDVPTGEVRYRNLSVSDPRALMIDGGTLFALSSEIADDTGEDWHGSATICAYNLGDCSLRWKRDTAWGAYEFDESYLPFITYATMYQPIQAGDYYVVPFCYGPNIVYLDVASGELISGVSANAPIVCFGIKNFGGATGLFAMDAAGSSYLGTVTGPDLTMAANPSSDCAQPIVDALMYFDGVDTYSLGFGVKDITSVLVTHYRFPFPDNPGAEVIEVSRSSEGIWEAPDHSRTALLQPDNTLLVLDNSSFEIETTIDLASLGIAESRGSRKVFFLRESSDLLMIADSGNENLPPAIWQIDVSSGEIVGTWEFPYDLAELGYTEFDFSAERNGYVTLNHPAGYLAHINAFTLETTAEFNVSELHITDMVVLDTDTYFILFNDGAAGQWHLDEEGAEQIGSGFDAESFPTSTEEAHIAVSPDGETYAYVTAMGTIGVISIDTGEIVWDEEMAALPAGYIDYSSDGELIFAQDANGAFLCFSADSGGLVARTDEVAGLIYACDASEDGIEIYVQSATDNMWYQVFCLSDDELVLVAEFEDAWALSPQGDAVMVRSALIYRQPIYTLEELKQMAQEVIDEHEGN